MRVPIKQIPPDTSDSTGYMIQQPQTHPEPIRKDEFCAFIRTLLGMSGLKKKHIGRLTDAHGMNIYEQAFTHSTVDTHRNYEWFEILGDATLNKCIVWYVSKRFPILQNPEGVKVIARLKINMVSKKKFSELAVSLGMPRFIRYDVNALPTHNSTAVRSIMEDVFEAFFGATEWLIDHCIEPGAGYGICFTILGKILDNAPISLEYNDLYDAVTRLKETFDMYRHRFPGTLRYDNRKDEFVQRVNLLHIGPHGSKCLSQAEAPTLDEAKQMAAQAAIERLEMQGISKPIPPYYLKIREWIRQHPDTA